MLNETSLFEVIQKLYKERERTSLLKKQQPDLVGSQESSQAAGRCGMTTTRCLGPRGLWVRCLPKESALRHLSSKTPKLRPALQLIVQRRQG